MSASPSRCIVSYRRHRLECEDDDGRGWRVTIHPAVGAREETLRNSVPRGMDVLLDEARRRVDRRLDGADWQHQP